MKLKCGYLVKKWNDAKREVRKVLIERAKAGDVIPYVDLTRNITAIQLEPQSFALTIMLREIAAEENAAGCGMLTAIVVYNSGDMQPGPGFFNSAGRLGKNTNDILRCWIKELKRVHGYWSTASLVGSKKTWANYLHSGGASGRLVVLLAPWLSTAATPCLLEREEQVAAPGTF